MASRGVRARVRSYSDRARPIARLSFRPALTKGPFGGYVSSVESSVESKAPRAVAGIGRTIEYRGEPLVERDLHRKVERQGRSDDPDPDNRRP